MTATEINFILLNTGLAAGFVFLLFFYVGSPNRHRHRGFQITVATMLWTIGMFAAFLAGAKAHEFSKKRELESAIERAEIMTTLYHEAIDELQAIGR